MQTSDEDINIPPPAAAGAKYVECVYRIILCQRALITYADSPKKKSCRQIEILTYYCRMWKVYLKDSARFCF